MTPDAIPRPTRSRFAFLHPRVYLGLHGVVGLLLAAACTWLFFAIADEVPETGAMVRVDNTVATWPQAHGTEAGETIFVGVSYLGAQVLTALLNGVLKIVFHRARPTYAVEFHAASWSFPSGHAMDSLIVYGLFALLARRTAASISSAHLRRSGSAHQRDRLREALRRRALPE